MKLLIVISFFLITAFQLLAQEESDSVEVYLIDSFVTPEVPHTFVLSFFTSASSTSKVIIDNKYTFPVSDELTESHKQDIDISKLEFIAKNVPFVIVVKDSLGREFTSETYEFELPEEQKIEGGSNLLLLCLFGAVDFIIPSPVYVQEKKDSYFSLTKEIPLVSFRGSNYKYPIGYISAEYSHIFNAPIKNFVRVGYKQIIPVPGIEYVAPGFNGFTNFKGYNGISPELSLGLFRIANTFTVYARYRFNAKPGDAGSEFHEFSIGLYSSFFSLYF